MKVYHPDVQPLVDEIQRWGKEQGEATRLQKLEWREKLKKAFDTIGQPKKMNVISQFVNDNLQKETKKKKNNNYWDRNRDKSKENNKNWRERNPDKSKENNKNCRISTELKRKSFLFTLA